MSDLKMIDGVVQETCVNCRHWKVVKVQFGEGECRRYAPRPRQTTYSNMSDEDYTQWAVVCSDEWCGEWEVKRNG